jgi:hypothetical protein
MSFEYFWVESCAVDLYEAWALNRAASVQNNNWLYAVFSIECALFVCECSSLDVAIPRDEPLCC